MNLYSVSVALFFLFFTPTATQSEAEEHIRINCGSPAYKDDSQWLGDQHPHLSSFVQLKGSSTISTTNNLINQSPYSTARISQTQFSYTFQLHPGPKIIRLHFQPYAYKGFKEFIDVFSVEAGPFTLLHNFSASLTGVNSFIREFCLYLHQDEQLDIVFFPISSLNAYAFVNGIEIISVDSEASYFHGGDIGVQLIGHRPQVYVDYATALERVHRLVVIKQSYARGDFHDSLPVWSARKANLLKDNTWKVPVDVGFRYLIRLHLTEPGHKIVASGNPAFTVLINEMVADTDIHKLDENEISWYMDYMVTMRGQKEEAKRDISISVQSDNEMINGRGIVEAIEVLKLSNPDNSLASPNSVLPPFIKSRNLVIQKLLAVLVHRNTTSTVAVMILSLVGIVVHALLSISEASSGENMPSIKVRCRNFSLAEIKLATRNYSDSLLIGRGGFGKVYKGFIDNGQTTVAVKRLKPDSSQGVREYLMEIKTLSELRHFNLVSLIGYCSAYNEMILVYDYMVGGTLADHLHKLPHQSDRFSHLTWKQRLNICIGAARGLDYLHTGQGLIHRDVKSSNILLDENLEAKVSDFGLAKHEDRHRVESHVSTIVKGTTGYLDPHYIITNKITRKSDTYAIGVVLLEILCGRPPVNYSLEGDEHILTKWAQERISDGCVDEIVASSLRDEISERSLKDFVALAERCLDYEPKKRPTMAQVVLQLESVLEQLDWTPALELNENARDAGDGVEQQRAVTSGIQHVKPTPIEQTAGIELENEEIGNKKHRTQHFWLWKVFRNRVKWTMPEEATAGAGTNAFHVNKKHLRRKQQKENSTIAKSSLEARGSSNSPALSINTSLKEKFWTRATTGSRRTLSSNSCRDFSFQEIIAATDNFHNDFKGSMDPSGTRATTGSSRPLSSNSCRHFSFQEIIAATDNFCKDFMIGRGRFSIVYKGFIDCSGTMAVAIKLLSVSLIPGAGEFVMEIEMLSTLRHRHLVSLIGYCDDIENAETIVVYEFMEHGTLHEHLFNSENNSLEWKQRLRICIGAARGLHFLHASTNRSIIHGDIKSTNILLNENWEAKISDFGLSKVVPIDYIDKQLSAYMKGSPGYIDPEYYQQKYLTDKSDVYSFGIVLFEVLSSRPAVWENERGYTLSLAGLAKMCHQKGTIDEIIDPKLKDQIAPKCLNKFVKTAIRCLGIKGTERPKMIDVIWDLEAALLLQEAAEKDKSGFMSPAPTKSPLLEQKDPSAGRSDNLDHVVFSDIRNPVGR